MTLNRLIFPLSFRLESDPHWISHQSTVKERTDFLEQQGRLKSGNYAVVRMAVQTIAAGIQDLSTNNGFPHGLILLTVPDLLDGAVVDVSKGVIIETAGADIAVPGHVNY